MKLLSIYKAVIVLVIAVIAPLLLPLKAKALDYQVGLEFDINILENRTASVTQKVKIINNSQEFLSTSLSLYFPFEKVSALQVESMETHDFLPATIENSILWVEFTNESLDYGEQKELLVKYQIPNFVESFGDVRAFSWPVFVAEEEQLTYPVRINYPLNWEDVLYSSQGIDMSATFDTKRAIAYNNVTKPISIYTGRYSVKKLQLKVDSTADTGNMTIPLQQGFYFWGANDSTKITAGKDNSLNQAIIDMQKYAQSKNITLITTNHTGFEETLYSDKYFEGVDSIMGVNTDDPTKIYKILLTRLAPDTAITQLTRNSVKELLQKQEHTDLDYANTLVAIFQSKQIPSRIAYGMIRYPDGKFYWHFWVLYLENQNGKKQWKEVDPYLEEVTGYQHFEYVPPVRLIWGTLNPDSDLSDLSRDMFSLYPDNFQLRYFSTPFAQTGYITSQLNKQNIELQNKSVLGDYSARNVSENDVVGSYGILLTGIGLLAIAAFTYKFKLK